MSSEIARPVFSFFGTLLNMEDEALSHGQRSLWFLHHLAPEGAAYNIAAAARLLAPVEPETLERALQALVDRHAALRTAFPSVAGEPCQRIEPSREFTLACEDAAGWSEERLRSRLAEEAWRPFDLAQGPLLRVTLWTGGPSGPVILLVIHHIIADFWSLALLMRELPVLYRGARLPPPGLGYGEHVRLEREILEDGRGEELLAYWKEKLAALPVLEMATDRSRPSIQTYRGDCARLRLPADLASALRALSRAQHGTLFMLLIAAFQALLGRHSGQEDLVVGAPRAGRSRSGFAGTVGYFVNPVVLRGDLSGDPSFTELLERTKAMVAEAFEHGDIPLPVLAERLQPERDASRTALFQVSFVMQKETRGVEGLTAFALGEEGVEAGPEDFRLASLSLRRPPAPFDLMLHAVERQGELRLALQYNTDLFDAATAVHLLDRFAVLLQGIVRTPDLALSALPMLPEAERHQVLFAWNDTAGPEAEATVFELFAAQAERTPDEIALVFEEERLTYGELASRARTLAQHLVKLGVGPEVLVGVEAERSIEMVVGLLGVLGAGGAYLPLEPSLPRQRLAMILEDARPAVVLRRDSIAEFSPRVETLGWKPLSLRDGSRDQAAYVIYTSGSTGRPKGVVNSHRGILNRLLWMRDAYGLDASERFLQKTPFGFDVSVPEFFLPLILGARLVVARPEGHRDAAYLVDLVRREGITTIHFVPSMLPFFLEEEGVAECRSLRRILVSGEALPWEVEQRCLATLPVPLINLYGPTEAAVEVTAWECRPAAQARPVPIGRPIRNTRIHGVGRRLEPVPPGAVGELMIGGVQVARGYLGRPDLTAERFVPDPFSGEPGARLYRTGDRSRHLRGGEIEYLGRLDDQVKIRGFRIEPREIELALVEHPAVREAAVVLRQDGAERSLLACVVPREGEGAELAAALRGFVASRLPPYMVPLFAFGPALDRLPNGKLDRRMLARWTPAAEAARAVLAPRTAVEERLAGLFADVLGIERIGVEESFFEHGGHSLSAMRLIARVRQELGVDLPLHRVFETPTVAALARAVEGVARSGAPPLERAERGRPLPLSFAQQRLWFLHQMEPASPVYNMPAAVHLRGRLDPAALAAALAEVARRHEALRTRFASDAGGPVQIVDPPAPVPLPAVDLAGLPRERRTAEARRLSREEALRPFDLARGPVLRAALVRLGGEEQVLLPTLHHIAGDGWSLRLLASELGAVYGAFAAGRPSPLPELEIQYGDYAVWQRRRLAGELLAAELAHWRERLAGAPPVLDLPLDRPRPAVLSARSGSRSVVVSPSLLGAAQALAQRQGATLFMTLLAAFQALLARVSGAEDVSVGTPVAGRGEMRTEGLIGTFVNMLVLRTDLSGGPSFAGLVERVRAVALTDFAHQELPLETLVEELQPRRDLSVPPLFQAAFTLDSDPPPALRLGEVEASLWPLEQTEKFDLSLVLGVAADGLSGALGFRCDLFDGTTLERLAGHFTGLLAAAATDPQRPFAELPLLAPAERHQIVAEWNDTREAAAEATLHALFAAAAERTPGAVAAVCAGSELTYAELAARSHRVAHLLRDLGIGKAPVGVWVERSFDLLAAVLGVLEAGGHYVALDDRWPAGRAEAILAATGAPVVIAGSGLLPAVEEMRWRLPALSDTVCLGIAEPEPPAEEVDPESVRALWDFVTERAVDRVFDRGFDRILAGGFISAFTGEPMSEAEVDEYRDRVLALASPWLRPDARVLEIGNGSGLLLWEMASRVAHVTGIDPSPLTQERNREHAVREGFENVELLTGFAHETEGLLGADERFDLILLASTVQFFPGPRYLERVVKWAQGRLAPGGALLVADVLDARRQGELRRAIEAAGRTGAVQRPELVLDEDLFRDLGGEVHHRIEGFPNELRFRYDVLFPEGTAGVRRKRLWTGWHVDRCPSVRPPEVAAPDDLAYLIHTSGSTGEPKGIAVQHRPAAQVVEWVNRTFGIGPEDRVLFVTSLGFDLSVYDIFGLLAAGGTVHVATREELGDPDRLVALLRSGGITVWDSAPAALVQLAPLFPSKPETASRLRRVLLSGDWIPVTLPDRVRQAFPGAEVKALGGATEATVWSNWFPVAAVDPRWVSIPYGRPIANARYHVLDGGFAPCPIGVPGDLYIGGGCLAVGYTRRALTAQAFLPDPFAQAPGDRLYRTGDRARHRADGTLEILGRLDQQVKVRGYRIELGEIEVALARHPAVRESVVAVREDEPGDRRLVAYVVPREGDGPEGEPADLPMELKSALRRSLPEYMVPAAFVLLDALPVTANGKLDRAALPAPQRGPGAALEEPRTPAEEALAAIWSAVLGVPRVGRQDNFFDLGGHSLLATQMVSRVRASCGVDLPLRTLFARPILADLAADLAAAVAAAHPSLAEEALRPAARPAGGLPLSFAQERLWFLDQLEPGSPAYNIPAAVDLVGPLHPGALAGAFAEVVRRHEVLRTRFAAAAGAPVQIAEPAAGFSLPLIDLQGLPDRAAEAERLAAEEARRAFDLRRGPLLRVALLRLAGGRHTALVTLHHIAGDGWSMGVLVRELGALYAAFLEGGLEGHPSPLPEPAVQYADFAVWQRRRLAGEHLEAEVAWWRERLAGMPPALELPVDHPRPAVRNSRGAVHRFTLGAEALTGLAPLARQQGATLFMALLAGFAALLQRAAGGAGEDDLVVGTPVAGRTRPETEPLIGFFVNTLALRLDLAGSPGFLELLDRVRETALAAFAHQEVPFERLVEELAPERDRSRPPLVQAMLALQNAAAGPMALPGLELEVHPLSTGTAKFELSLMLAETADGLTGEIEFSRDLFDEPTVARLAGHFQHLLAAAVADPRRPVPELELLAPAERHRLLVEWNDTEVAPGSAVRVHELVVEQARRRPEALAVAAPGEQLRYGELVERAGRLAEVLVRHGVGPEVRVALCAGATVDRVVGSLAVLLAGGAYVPMDPEAPAERLRYLVADSGAAVVLAEGRSVERFQGSTVPLVALRNEGHPEGESRAGRIWAVERSAHPDPSARSSLQIAYVVYTSGSTGQPKGVAVPHAGLLNLVRWHCARYRVGPSDRATLIANPAFDASVWELWPYLAAGASVHIPEDETRLSPEAIVRFWQEEGITWSFLPTPLAEEVAGSPHPRPLSHLPPTPPPGEGGTLAEDSSRGSFSEVFSPLPGTGRAGDGRGAGGEGALRLQALLCGGDRLHRAPGPGLPFDLINHYGPSEVSVVSTFTAVPPGEPGQPPIGRPIDGIRAYVADPWGGPALPGGAGELWIGGVGLARGYLGRPALTAERFVPDPWSGEAGARLYRTGDLMRCRPDGDLEFLGRIDHQIKLRGFRIEPGEIEAVLRGHPGVSEAVVAVVHGALVAWVVGASGEEPAAGALRQSLRERLPGYMVPAACVVLPALPLLPNGKLDRKALPAPEALAGEGGEEAFQAPRTQAEERLAGIFAAVLGRERVGIDEDFFALGGHSLLATQVVSRIREALGVDLPLRALFEAPTVAALAALVSEGVQPVGTVPSHPLADRGREMPLSFAQQRLWFLDQMEPGSPLYTIAAVVELRGALHRPALEAAFAEVVRRHEALRTTFEEVGGTPVQIVHDSAGFAVPLIDLQALPERGRSTEADRLATEEARRPFHLQTGPLLRASLLRLAGEHHTIVLTMHHIVSDGWSTGVLVRELGSLYAAFLEGRPSPLPELPVQVADVAAWQREQLAGERLESEVAWWREELAGMPTVLELPVDHPRPAVRSVRGEVHAFSVGAGLLSRFSKLVQEHRGTLFMGLLAALAVLLQRFTGQDDLAVGTPVAGRLWPETELLIGLFVNTLVLRVDLAEVDGFLGLVGRVRERALAAFAHQETPFERLVEELAPERDRGRPPLIQVMLALQNAPAAAPEFPGLEVAVAPVWTGTAKVELALVLTETGNGLDAAIEYASGLFDGTTAARLAGCFTRLLEAAVNEPERRPAELPLLGDGERHQLLFEWNDTRAPFPEATLLHQFFEASVERSPEAVAAVCAGQELTYAGLEARSNRLAHLLRGWGVERGTPVGVWVERSFDMLTAVLGVLKAGGHYVALDEAWPADRVETILSRTGAPAVVVGPGLLPAMEEMRWRLPKLSGAVCLGIAGPEPPAEAIDPASVRELWDLVAERAVDRGVFDRILAGGFVSAFTGEPMSDAEVDEYRDRVLSLASPWLRPDARVLEIGNGSGLLLWEMAARAAHVTGIDPSPLTQERNREHAAREGIGNVELRTGFAHEAGDLLGEDERFDLILLASTVQFFPGPRYLERVVRWAQSRLVPGGAVLIADVLDARRREELRRAIEAAGGTVGSRRQELSLDEDLFRDLGGEVYHRTEGFPNELRYRYDVLLTGQPAGERRKRLWTGWHAERFPSGRLPRAAAPDDIAYVIHTSGSTGEPKGIAVQHRPAANLVDWVNRTFEIGPQDRGLFVTSLCFDLSVYDVFGVLGAGGTVHVATRAELGDPDGLVDLLRSGGITLWDSAPAALAQLAPLFPAAPEAGSRLRRVLLSGDWIPVTLPDRVRQAFPGAQVMALGGTTEATVWSNWFPVGEVDPDWPSIPYGRPIANSRYHVLDAGFEPCPIGVPGDLYTGGDGLSTGYARRPDLTAQAFLPDPFAETPGARLYRTGDRARYHTDGNLEFLGRLDHQVKVRGYRIELGEIEVALARHSGVREAVVLVREDEPGDRRLVAYVVLAGDPAADLPADLRDALRRSLPEYMIPSAFVRLDELPVTPNGKLDRAALPAPQWSAGAALEEPRTPTEAALAAIWASVLGVPRVGRQDSFFDLGGHSLLATQMMSRVREACGVDLPLRTLFERPKLADLAAVIEPAAGERSGLPALQPVPRTEPDLPLSFAQERLWFLQQLEPGSATYNIPVAVELSGALQGSALAAALTAVVQRQESLRTTFTLRGGVPRQRIAPIVLPASLPLPLADLSGLPALAAGAEAERLEREQAGTGLDLERGPLAVALLVRLSGERRRFLLAFHHAIADGWSIGVLVRELGELYAAAVEGRSPRLPELPIQVADFASWQRRWLADEPSALAAWEARLGGERAPAELPTDRPRPAVQTFRGGQSRRALSPDLTARLKSFGRAEGVTLFMTLLAAAQALLSRQSGEPDVTVGAPVAGRHWSATEGLIGCFLNTLALRTDLSGSPGFRELTGRVRTVTLEAYAHQDVPFEAVLARLRLDRDLSRTPLFQVLFNMLNLPRPDLALPGLALRVLTPAEAPSKFDATFYVSERDFGVDLHLVYNADLFDEARMSELLAQLDRLLTQAMERPDEPVDGLSLVTEQASALLPDPAAPLDAGWIGGVHELFAAQAARAPERPAVIDAGEEGTVWSYGDLLAGSRGVAGWLAAQGVRRGDPVAIFAHRSAPLVQAVQGVLTAGAAFLILDPAYPAARLAEMLRLASPRALVALEAAGPAPDAVRSWLDETGCPCLELPAGGRAALESVAVFVDEAPRVAVGPHDLACIGFTSGSTGGPKGILGLHGSLSHFLPAYCAELGLGPDDRFSLLSGLSHDPLQRDIFTPLFLGAAIIVPDPADYGIAGRLAGWMGRERVTAAHLTPALSQLLTAHTPGTAPPVVPSLRRAILIGEALTRQDVARLRALAPGVTCFNLYGATETQRALAFHRVAPEEGGRQVLPLGRGFRDAQLLVMSPAGQLAGIGEIGEIAVRSPHLARGYLGDEALTAERFQLNPFTGVAGDRIYCSGDLGRYLPNGEVELVGRADLQVKLRGFRIELSEIEAALVGHPAVQEAVVLLRQDLPAGGGLVACVVPAAPGLTDAAQLQDSLWQHLWQRLPAYMVPAAFVFQDSLPRSPSGKIDRRSLAGFLAKAEVAAPSSGGEGALHTPAEEIVAGLWAEVLGRGGIGPDDNFFQLGGHSLTGAQIVSRLRGVFQVELPLRVLFEAPTVAALAAEVERRRRGHQGGGAPERPSITSFRQERSAPPPLSFAQERFWAGREAEARSVASTIPMLALLEGPLDLDCLRRALQEVVDRHEVLRTCFREDAPGRLVQVIHPGVRVEFPTVDLEGLAPLAQRSEAGRWGIFDAQMPFDYERGPLFRLTLFRLAAEQSAVLFTVHHAAFDGWSRPVLVRELAVLYDAFRAGRPSPLPPLAAQYQDFARWQRQTLAGEALEREVSFWREHLRGAEPLDLADGHPRPAHPTFEASSEVIVIPEDLERGLEALAESCCATLFMTLLTGLLVLLQGETGQDDIVVTCLFANRNQLETENLIGNFFAGLPLRTRLSGARTFRELLERVREVTLAAHEHSDILYESVREGLSLETFRVLFQLAKLPPTQQALSDLKVTRLPVDTGKIRQDLSLFLSQSDRLGGRFRYNRDVLDAERVARLRDRYLQILAAMAAGPDEPWALPLPAHKAPLAAALPGAL